MRRRIADLIVRSVLFEMRLNTAAKLKDPTPLGLQSCGESLGQKKSTNEKHTNTHKNLHSTAKYPSQTISYLNSLSAWMTVLNESVSSDLDVIDLLLPKLQLPHQSLRHGPRVKMQMKISRHKMSFKELPVSVLQSSSLSLLSCSCYGHSSQSWPPPPPYHWATWAL